MLEVSVPIAHELLAQCVRQGQALVQRASLVGDFSDYESWKAARNQWVEPTAQALEHMYDGSSQAAEFTQTIKASANGQRWQQQYAADLDAVKAAIDLLTVLQGDLAFARDDADAPSGAPELMASHDPAPAPSPVEQHPALPEPQVEQPEQPQSKAQHPQPPSPEAQQPEPAVPEAQHPEPHAPDAVPEAQHSQQPEPQAAPQRDEEESVQWAEPADAAERVEQPTPVGAELAPTAFVGAELAQHANGSVSAERAGSPSAAGARGKQVLLAHGRNEQWMQAVARLLEQAGTHEVTILNERPNGRGGLSEQFGEHAPGSRYAVVLLTADDIAAPRVQSEDEPYFSPRAHQAVVFEMGFLVAALAPGCVCVLYEEGVQPPCDLDGIAYIRLDSAGTWQPKLLLQLRKAGFDYDTNKLVAA
ncbi:MAG TPA: TIR domain-containing protein [Solirubrobacteraceae bacterium]|jgi:predicted nucleotide-binding protein|nr:TIR domain-containing protein [Solirubrobacteraceae bacterium]